MLEEPLKNLLTLLRDNPAMALASASIVAALFYFKTKEMIKLVLFGLFIVVIFYFITLFAGTLSSGSKQKDQMIYKSRGIIDE